MPLAAVGRLPLDDAQVSTARIERGERRNGEIHSIRKNRRDGHAILRTGVTEAWPLLRGLRDLNRTDIEIL